MPFIRKGTGLLVAVVMVAACGGGEWFGRTDVDGANEEPIGVSTEALEIPCAAAPTLEALVACVRDAMPVRGSEGYVAPSATALAEIGDAVTRMMNGYCDFELGASIAPIMRLRTFTDGENGKKYCVMLEVVDGNGDGFVDRGWGTFIVDPSASRELSHQAPHPLSDLDTELEAVGLFKRTDARSFLLCGAHRHANGTRACDRDYQKADCAHDAGSMFFVASREIARFYGSRPHHQIQWHGMGTDTCEGVTAYLSPGMTGAPPADSPVRTLDAEVEAAHPTWSVKMPGSGTCTLNATDNVEGRHLNGVSPDSVCSTAATSTSGRFIHVEQKREARDPLLWVTPVTRAFPIPTPTPPTSVNATASGGGVTVSWVASTGASSYAVQRGTTSGGPYEVVANVSTTSWVDTNVVSRFRYYYVVTATNSRGTSAPSSQVVVRAR
ncbi:fibronectin type III domain-containing protein [Polyangium spumosum]|uniref:Fibronectin type-III domain-containing protein n=1 Tax=Polyangium spumosum TaxID=889282 RepID=A0A6N7PP33_9BACT|nr:fibronectin type III domain-containing protein [Polyangium spumosum]MRG91884.1 hypothetical protein [Polyangium spumosum]